MEIVRIKEHPGLIPIVAKWLYDQWGHNRPDGSILNAERGLMSMPDEEGLPVAFIAIKNSEPVGVARLVRNDMGIRKELSPWLASVFTPAGHRNHGVATALCNRVVAEAHKLGFAKLYLFTPDREAFYLRQGWQTVEHTVYREEKVVIMRIIP